MTQPGFFEGTGMPDAGWWEALWPHPAGVLESVGLAPRMIAVDLCSGDGWFTSTMARVATHVIAIDIDARLLELSRKRLAERGIANCEFVAGDAYELRQLVQEPVDFLFLANSFHGVPDQPRLCREIFEVLKSGGKLAIVNWHPRRREETKVLGEPRGPKTEMRMSLEATIESVEGSVLVFVKSADVSPYHYAAIFERPNA